MAFTLDNDKIGDNTVWPIVATPINRVDSFLQLSSFNVHRSHSSEDSPGGPFFCTVHDMVIQIYYLANKALHLDLLLQTLAHGIHHFSTP